MFAYFTTVGVFAGPSWLGSTSLLLLLLPLLFSAPFLLLRILDISMNGVPLTFFLWDLAPLSRGCADMQCSQRRRCTSLINIPEYMHVLCYWADNTKASKTYFFDFAPDHTIRANHLNTRRNATQSIPTAIDWCTTPYQTTLSRFSCISYFFVHTRSRPTANLAVCHLCVKGFLTNPGSTKIHPGYLYGLPLPANYCCSGCNTGGFRDRGRARTMIFARTKRDASTTTDVSRARALYGRVSGASKASKASVCLAGKAL